MAVAVEGTPTQVTDYGSSLTFSHTCGGNGLFVGAGSPNDATTFSSITFNGDSLTEKWDEGYSMQDVAGYIMVAPDAGAHNVVVTATATAWLWAGAVGLTGLHQSTPTRTAYAASGGSGGPTVTVVDSQSGDLVIDCAGVEQTTITVGAGQTSILKQEGMVGRSYGISTEPASGANTVMSWTANAYWSTGAMALVAAAGGANILRQMMAHSE
jgi:hypothetical protein